MKLQDMLEKLAAPIPERLISHKIVGGRKIAYIAWYDLADILDERTGFAWDWQIRQVTQVGQGADARIILVGALGIHAADASLHREATGTEKLAGVVYGDPSSNAEAMAFRRAAAKIGVGRGLWRKNVGRPPAAQSGQKQRTALSSSDRPAGGRQLSREEWEERRVEYGWERNPLENSQESCYAETTRVN